MTTPAESPIGIDRGRHQDLTGRQWHVWLRRVALLLVAAVPVVALADTFGQRATPVTYQSREATLVINSPERVRGGLIFTTEIVITAHLQLHNAELYLNNGWFRAMTLNGVAPQPANQGAAGRWQIWDYGALAAHVPFAVWISWQTNPTNIGRHSQVVELHDGSHLVMTAQRSITVFP